VGEHELVLKANLTNGKPFNLLLRGETIDKNVGVLSPLIGDNCLFPTPINISFPVTNQVMFKNAGNCTVTWTVNREKIKIVSDSELTVVEDDIDVLEETGSLEPDETGFITLL